MQHANLPENLDLLQPHDEVKFVLADRRDFDWSLELVARARPRRAPRRDVLAGLGDACRADELAAWVRDSGRPIRLGLQLHKILWGDVPGR